jgi:hypothetical protein
MSENVHYYLVLHWEESHAGVSIVHRKSCLMVLITACATSPGKERGPVHCPACGAELDALFEKRF